MKIIIIIPAFNEEKTIGTVIHGLKKKGYEIIVINDGSTDNTEEISRSNEVKVINHIINRGLGGAIATGLKAGLLNEADIIVTFDADGQHNPDDIPRLLDPIYRKEADVVIGSRMLENHGMPFLRKFYNHFGNFVTYLLFGIKTTDSQSGLRAFSREAAEKIEVRTNKMEVSSELMQEIKKNDLRLKEIPIKSIYTEYSLSKGQGFFTGIKTLVRLILLKLIK